MVPDKFNMVDLGGIDLIMMQGEAVPGLYDKLTAAISNCRYQCLYNWIFDGVLIPPAYAQLTVINGEVYLNEGVSVNSDDVIHIHSIEPEIIPLLAEENGVYNVPAGKSGFNPVTVDVPGPVINPISITENGTYTAPTGVDGYSPITVKVPVGSNYSVILNFEQGNVESTTSGYVNITYPNKKVSSNTAIRSQALFPIIPDAIYGFVFNDDVYDVALQPFNWGAGSWGSNPDANIYGVWRSSVSFTGQGGYVAIIFRRKDVGNITPSEMSTIDFSISITR